ncbi:MAG: cysteine--tRNA ligase, partial [Proteobacteria bacterium]|nr:cysteine--tRNA ligase [Pseudomonadota bacterium]
NKKMSKSLGNMVTLKDLRTEYPGEVLRYALLSAQYRSPLAWSTDLLDQAARSLDTLYQALRTAGELHNLRIEYFRQTVFEDLPERVMKPLTDDLNTPQALAAMHAIATDMNKADNPEEKVRLAEQLLASGWILGILNDDVDAHFTAGAGVDAAEVESLIEARKQARADHDFARADQIRDDLYARGIELEDTREGTRWKLITN